MLYFIPMSTNGEWVNDNQTVSERLEEALKTNEGKEASKGIVKKAGWVLWWRWGGARSKVSSPSDISCAREAVTTRSAEVQVSGRWLTDKAKRDLSTVHPDWAFYPSFPPSPRRSAPWPIFPFVQTLPSSLSLLTLYPQNPSLSFSHLSPILLPHSPSFSPL